MDDDSISKDLKIKLKGEKDETFFKIKIPKALETSIDNAFIKYFKKILQYSNQYSIDFLFNPDKSLADQTKKYASVLNKCKLITGNKSTIDISASTEPYIGKITYSSPPVQSLDYQQRYVAIDTADKVNCVELFICYWNTGDPYKQGNLKVNLKPGDINLLLNNRNTGWEGSVCGREPVSLIFWNDGPPDQTVLFNFKADCFIAQPEKQGLSIIKINETEYIYSTLFDTLKLSEYVNMFTLLIELIDGGPINIKDLSKPDSPPIKITEKNKTYRIFSRGYLAQHGFEIGLEKNIAKIRYKYKLYNCIR